MIHSSLITHFSHRQCHPRGRVELAAEDAEGDLDGVHEVEVGAGGVVGLDLEEFDADEDFDGEEDEDFGEVNEDDDER